MLFRTRHNQVKTVRTEIYGGKLFHLIEPQY
jgi:hypothetical protein